MSKPLSVISKLREMTALDLQVVLDWRNNPEVSKFMYSRHIISMDEHRRWFERASVDPNKRLLILDVEGVPLGFMSLHLSNEFTGVAEWGFYISPKAPKGTGRSLGNAALDYCFITLNLHKVIGRVLDFNQKSIKFHKSLGFTVEGEWREHYLDTDGYHSLVCFGILKKEWYSLKGDV